MYSLYKNIKQEGAPEWKLWGKAETFKECYDNGVREIADVYHEGSEVGSKVGNSSRYCWSDNKDADRPFQMYIVKE